MNLRKFKVTIEERVYERETEDISPSAAAERACELMEWNHAEFCKGPYRVSVEDLATGEKSTHNVEVEQVLQYTAVVR